MEGIDWWDLGLIGAATYFAATALVRLMLAYRDAKVQELKGLIQEHQRDENEPRKQKGGSQDPEPRSRSAA